jgi:hypothetical protein
MKKKYKKSIKTSLNGSIISAKKEKIKSTLKAGFSEKL